MSHNSLSVVSVPHGDSWASLVAELVKNLLAMWETWVRSLGWEAQLAKNLHVLWET